MELRSPCKMQADGVVRVHVAHLKAAVVMFRRTILSRASLYTAFVITLGFHARLDLQHPAIALAQTQK